MIRVAITGRPGCGKTTLIRKVVRALQPGLSLGGIYTEEIREGRARKGFAIIDISTGRRGLLAHTGLPSAAGPRVGKYRVNLKDIEELAVPAIMEALKAKELLVIDELAPMELASPKFVEAVEAALASECHLLFAVQERSAHPLAQRIRREFSVYEVTPSNRDGLFQELLALFT
ncbi:MAG: NTPase [Candidatus Acetothermia bacterium]|jgi:nucleoside-triphosphatase|nr:NTPase [Candidatus Acetothermia bacterium]MDH7504936.1 NTPase [Candidatus Acetothermia bacterium]